MASIKILNDIKNSAISPGDALIIRFSIKGKVKTSSSSFMARLKIDDNGTYKYLSANSYKTVDGNIIMNTQGITTTSYSGKEFMAYFYPDTVIDVKDNVIRFCMEIIGNITGEDNGELDIRSEEITMSGKKSAVFLSKIYSTKNQISSIKVKLNKEEYIVGSQPITYKVEATNNPYDKAPVWEDITEGFLKEEFYGLLNNVCESGRHGLQIRITMEKPNYSSYIRIYEIIIGII